MLKPRLGSDPSKGAGAPAIDQYAEAATGNREHFLNEPLSIGGSRKPADVL